MAQKHNRPNYVGASLQLQQMRNSISTTPSIEESTAGYRPNNHQTAWRNGGIIHACVFRKKKHDVPSEDWLPTYQMNEL